MVSDWGTVTIQALQNSWEAFLGFIPKLTGAVIIFIIGWFVSVGVGKLIAEILKSLKFDKIFERTGWRGVLEKAELDVNPSEFIGAICKWILIIVFLLASVEILGFVEFADFLRSILGWLPNLVVAIAIFVVAIVVADILEKIIKPTVKKAGIKYSEFLGAVIRWAVYIFAGLAILLQLGVTPTFINTLLVGFVGMISLAFGLAFGLGGKEAAARLIESIEKKLSEK